MSKIEKLVAQARRHPGPNPDGGVVVDAWRVAVTLQHVDRQELWQMSASLWPRGRSSIEADWHRLGALLAQAHRASGPGGIEPYQVNEGAPPDAVQHFAWTRATGGP